jgi:hypothetical protein
MTRALRPRPFVLLALCAVAAVGVAAFTLACTDQTTPPPRCLAQLTSATPTASAGTAVAVNLALVNPDNDSTSSAYIDWSVSGGGTLAASKSTATLVPQLDPYGNPGGVAGTATNTFRTTGPTGSYVVTAAVEPGGACPGASYSITIQVNGQVVDAGADASASDGAGDASLPDVTAPDADGADAGLDAGGDGAAADAALDG